MTAKFGGVDVVPLLGAYIDNTKIDFCYWGSTPVKS